MKRLFALLLVCCLFTYAVITVSANDQAVPLKEVLKTKNQALLAEILDESHWDDKMADVELEGQPMLLVYHMGLMGHTDKPYEQIISYAQSNASAEVFILQAKPIVLVEYQNKTILSVNTNWYTETPTFVKDVMYGSSVQTFFGESCTIENVICFTSRWTRQETTAVYETDKGKFVLYYEDNEASAIVFPWDQFAEYAKGYSDYIKWYNIWNPGTTGEILKFMDYCEAPEEYATIEKWVLPAVIILGVGVIAFCSYKVYKRKYRKIA